MANHKHIILDETYKQELPYAPLTQGGGTDTTTPEVDDLHAFADNVRTEYMNAIGSINRHVAEMEFDDVAKGYYFDIQLANANIAESVLNSKRGDVQLMTFSPAADDEHPEKVTATVYVPKHKSDWMPKKLDAYETKRTKSDKPRYEKFINRIKQVESSSILSFVDDKETFRNLNPNLHYNFELWMSNDDEMFANNCAKFNSLGLEMIGAPLKFTDTIVVLINAQPNSLAKVPFALDGINELRIYHKPSELTRADVIEQQAWVELLEESTRDLTNDGSIKIALLDTGVNNGHPLLQRFVSNRDCVAVIATDNADHDGHGTEMAGLSLYGDLAEVVTHGGADVCHRLVSVKMMPSDSEKPNSPDLYGVITEDAVMEARNHGAKLCVMPITEESYCTGEASSWSAAVDQILYNQGECNSLLLVSAGNINEDIPANEDYRNICKDRPIQSPAQSVNAITVGAYTEKVFAAYNPRNAQPIAESGDLSPFSRTSCPWRQMRIKPDIVMEGGNKAIDPLLGQMPMDDLSMVTTNANFRQNQFSCLYATSASTALAAKLVAEIQYANPSISSLSVRALIIHSAQWNDVMKQYDKSERLRMFGYGVPDRNKAIASQETNATFIYEGEMIPFMENADGGCAYHAMHHFQLPWPKQTLMALADTPVKMRVTLSYYIQPSPGRRSYKNLFKYQSAGLAFDVKLPEETLDSFFARHSKAQECDDKMRNRPDRWAIGIENRECSAVQSDWMELTAAQLSECGDIVVFPTTGWWKNRKISNIPNRIPYSLVVSIETPEQDIYTPIAQNIMIEV
jgi:hypothetical protein